MEMKQRLSLKARVEPHLPKLLVRISPVDGQDFLARNLGEAVLRKSSSNRGRVAVVNLSQAVPPGEVALSLRLAEILDVEEAELMLLEASSGKEDGEVDVSANGKTKTDYHPEARVAPLRRVTDPLPKAANPPSDATRQQSPGIFERGRAPAGGRWTADRNAAVSNGKIRTTTVDVEDPDLVEGFDAPLPGSRRPVRHQRPAQESYQSRSTGPSAVAKPHSFGSRRKSELLRSGEFRNVAGYSKTAKPDQDQPKMNGSLAGVAYDKFAMSGDVKLMDEQDKLDNEMGEFFQVDASPGSKAGYPAHEAKMYSDLASPVNGNHASGDSDLYFARNGEPSQEKEFRSAPFGHEQKVMRAQDVNAVETPRSNASSTESISTPRNTAQLPWQGAFLRALRCKVSQWEHEATERDRSSSQSSASDSITRRRRPIPVAAESLVSSASSDSATSSTRNSPRPVRRFTQLTKVTLGKNPPAEPEFRSPEPPPPPAPPPPLVGGSPASSSTRPCHSQQTALVVANGKQSTGGTQRGRGRSSLGFIQTDNLPPLKSWNRTVLPNNWRGPVCFSGEGLERSELGFDVTVEVRRWLLGEVTGRQCAEFVLDRAATVPANFKHGGWQIDVLGGPLGAVVGGYRDAEWLYSEVFAAHQADAVQWAFTLLNVAGTAEGDWSNVSTEDVSLAYRRICIRSHPNRGGKPKEFLRLQVAMEIVRAFSGEAGPLELSTNCRKPIVLRDVDVAKQLDKLSLEEVEEAARSSPMEDLELENHALDEYILRQMQFKSEIIDEIARLHENCAYAILGVSADASDGEIRKAYKIAAMQAHPDKGGDKEEFQELNSAYEKIMERRKGTTTKDADDGDRSCPSSARQQNGAPRKGKSKTDNSEADADDDVSCDLGRDSSKDSDEVGNDKEANAADGMSSAELLEKAERSTAEALKFAQTAQGFASQAAESAEAARNALASGSRDAHVKSMAHSSIVLTLMVVKAVRVVGYATLETATQTQALVKGQQGATLCQECAGSAMSLGFEALNAALICAEVTEEAAAELQGCQGNFEGPISPGDCFVAAALKASLAATKASAAAYAAAQGGAQAYQEGVAVNSAAEAADTDQGNPFPESADGDKESPNQPNFDADQTCSAPDDSAGTDPLQHLVKQRTANLKVLQRLNAEILTYQGNVRQFLQRNRAVIPEVSAEDKKKLFEFVGDCIGEAREALLNAAHPLEMAKSCDLISSLLSGANIAVTISVQARALRLAALYDMELTKNMIQEGIFAPLRQALPVGDVEAEKSCTQLYDSVVATIANVVSS